MKRVFALLLAVALVLSLGVTAFAAENENGSITITNATIGHTYKAYKIFDATYGVDNEGNTDAFSYTISETIMKDGVEVPNPIFEYMFGENTTKVNDCFAYDAEMHTVTKKHEQVTKEAIAAYLSEMIRAGVHNGYVDGTYDAVNKQYNFTGLEYGYYVIDKDITSTEQTNIAVTIDSVTPHADVIDKNQKPGTNFSKFIVEKDANGNEILVTSNSASIGTLIDYRVQFDVTNYDGEKQIQYYAVRDTKGDALWVEFDSITVKILNADGTLNKELTKGYYSNLGDISLDPGYEWQGGLGVWGDTPVHEDSAEWYLIHHGYDDFEIVIPWMTNYDFIDGTGDYSFNFGEGASSPNPSPAKIVIEYDTYIEYDADIGNVEDGNLWNSVDLNWYFEGGHDGPPNIPSVETTTYAIGLSKVDSDVEGKYLAGAVFHIYADEEHQVPVYVIPTDIEGVYILDDYIVGDNVSGENLVTVRDHYQAYLDAYLNGATQKNEVVTPVNGKIVILGLEAGTYYLDEVQAPDGYNTLPTHFVIAADPENQKNFFIIRDENKNAVNKQDATEQGLTREDYVVTPGQIYNSKGMELPSTGGEGRIMLLTIGTMVALGFAVLLITQKKMSVYKD